MKKIRIINKIKLAFAAAVLFTGLVLAVMYANMRKTASESANVRTALSILLHLENLLVKIQAVETGQRGYIISGDTAFLSGYNHSLKTIDEDIKVLQGLPIYDDTKADLNVLIGLVNEKVRRAKITVETRRVMGYDSAAVYIQQGIGQGLMNRIIKEINGIEEGERQILQRSNKEREAYANSLIWLYFILALLFGISIVSGYTFIIKDFKRSEIANQRIAYNSTLLKNISDAIITTDADLRITDWNIYAEELYGYKEEEVKGKKISDILRLPHGIFDHAPHANNKSEILHRHKDGSLIYAEISASELKDEKGKITGTISVIHDVTERVKLRDELKSLSENLQRQVNIKVAELNLFFERITDCFIAFDNDFNFTYMNKAAQEMQGIDSANVLGKNIWELFPAVVGQPFYNALHEARATQKAIHAELYYSVEDKWYEDLIYPGKDGISVYYRDITLKKKAEQQLKISEDALKFSNERFELVAKATNDAIWDWDMQDDTLTGNESFCRLLEVPTGSSLHYDDFLNKVHPDDRERIDKNFKNALNNQEVLLTEEFRFSDSAGNYRTVYDRAYILYNDNAKGYRMLGAMQDISAMKEAEHKLLLEKELSDSIINSLPGIFYLTNKAGWLYLWNKNFETVTGYSAEEIKKLHSLDLFVDAEKDMVKEKIENVFATGSDNAEVLLVTKSGETIPYYLTGMSIMYESESCLMGVGIDVSEKVRSQKELVESEEKFRTLVQLASDGIIITDTDGNFHNVNDSFSLLTGYTKEALLTMTAYNVFHETDTLEKPFRYEDLQNGTAVITERIIKRKNGRLINVEVSAKQLPDGLFQGIIRDISERKLVEEALRMSERKYRILFNENPLPMWILSLPYKNFLDINSAAIISYGYSREEFLRMNLEDLHPELSRESDEENIRVKDGTMRHEGIWDHQRKDGSIIKVNVIAHNITYEGKSAILVLANDITAKFEAEANLQKSHEALRELASHLETIREKERTHIAREIHDELGQQLTGLKMDISWINKKIHSDDNAVNEKLKDIIQLIDKTVITVRRIATQLRPSILDDLGLVAAMEWQSDEFEKRADIKCAFTTNVSNITVSPEIATGIFRIFQESLTNVLRHSQATEVNTSFTLEDNIITLVIEDNGVGFKEENIINKKTLGLLGMKERAFLINGTYEINGDTGRGTSVIITVPLI